MLELVRVVEVGKERKFNAADVAENHTHPQQHHGELVEEKKRLLLARAVRLEAEARLMDDVGAYYKGLAALTEAEADIKIAEKDRVEALLEDQHIQKLLRTEMAANLVRSIRKARFDGKRNAPTGSPQQRPFPRRPSGGPNRGGGRVDQRPKTEEVVSPQSKPK